MKSTNNRLSGILCGVMGLFYCLAAYVTGLNWIPFRDEGLYLGFARRLSSEWPTMHIMRGVNGTGNLISMVIVKTVGDNIAIFRLVTVTFAVACIYLACDVSGCFRAVKRWKYTFIMASLPMFFIYSFQVNGFIIGIFFALLIMKLYLERYGSSHRADDGAPWMVDAGLFLACAGAAVTNPFLLAYPATIIGFEVVRMVKERKVSLNESRLALLCFLSMILFWIFGFVFANRSMINPYHSMSIRHNPQFLGLYLGYIPILLMFLGVMFPFLGFSFRKRINFLVFLVILTVGLLVSARLMPATLTAHYMYHCLFLKIADVVRRSFSLPLAVLETIAAVLIGLGIYNLTNVLYQSKKDFVFFFSICTGMIYFMMILIFSEITARLLIPGMLGTLFLICRVYEQRPGIMRLQMAYQVVLTAIYVYALYSTRGFFNIIR